MNHRQLSAPESLQSYILTTSCITPISPGRCGLVQSVSLHWGMILILAVEYHNEHSYYLDLAPGARGERGEEM